MTTVDLIHPGTMPGNIDAATEKLGMRPTDTPGHFELTTHSFLIPLGPGDIVSVQDGCIVEVISLKPQWIYMVDLHLPADYLAGPMPAHHPGKMTSEQLIELWRMDAEVTAMTTFNLWVSTTNERWFQKTVPSSKFVEHVELVRDPTTREVQIP